jgi:hypothetical protein
VDVLLQTTMKQGTQLLCEQVIGRALRPRLQGTYPAQLKYKMLADMACNKITAGITRAFIGQRPIKAELDPLRSQ